MKLQDPLLQISELAHTLNVDELRFLLLHLDAMLRAAVDDANQAADDDLWALWAEATA